jgi:FkbM family methyltransferase
LTLPNQVVVFYSTLFGGEYEQLRIREGDVIVDAGANVGDFTLLAAIRTGPNGRVIAIEPEPRNASLLRRNLAINNLSNVIVVEAALSDSVGTATFKREGIYSRLLNEDDRYEYALKVGTITLDRLKADLKLSRIDIVKMDIEGGEVDALTGQVCLQEVKQIAVEAHGVSNREDVTKILATEGFKLRPMMPRDTLGNVTRNCIFHLPSFMMAEFRTKGYALREGRDFLLRHGRHVATPYKSGGNPRIIYASRLP